MAASFARAIFFLFPHAGRAQEEEEQVIFINLNIKAAHINCVLIVLL